MVPDSMDKDVMACEVHTVPDDEDDDIIEEEVEVTYTPGQGTMMAAKREPPRVYPEQPRSAITQR